MIIRTVDITSLNAHALSFADHNRELATTATKTADAIDDKRDEINVRMQRAAEHYRQAATELTEVARILTETHSDEKEAA